ncbi:GTPase Era [Endozoicomonas montiporae]|uniref:GTPase Era n=1 Tax=Endozoicomonas montiporae CL-33 TaxID=570277 RepID=A0A142BDX4_9GAMM|nr:GTPase Era [Endozoicomonas montiporae]AMO56950.1 GTP-binding protein Era [Endozoicomonas montiporae CL-33]
MSTEVNELNLSVQNNDDTRCGYVAIVGRPNVGKSTLLNHILGQKLSITSRRPQTTRHQVLGIKTEDGIQTIYVDTPGMHKEQKKAINRYMNRAATSALTGVDAIVFVVDRLKWNHEDQLVLDKLQHASCPVILAVNKVDRIEDKAELMPHLQELADKHDFKAIMPISAQHGHNLKELETMIEGMMPESIHFYPEDQVTDRSSRFMAAELVREKIMRQLGDELPYEMTVEIEEFKHEMRPKGPLLTISALILVERQGQKAIVIGDKGARLKTIGQEARKDMEHMFDAKVMLNLWVKVKGGWSDDDRALKSLGYDYSK